MFDPRDFTSDPRTRPEARPRRDHAKEREDRERDGHRREYDPRGTKRQTFQDRTDRAIADVGMYRNVAYRDVVDAHFEGHPYTARRAEIYTWVARRARGELMLYYTLGSDPALWPAGEWF